MIKLGVLELEEEISSQKNEYGCELLLVGGRWEESRGHGNIRTTAIQVGASTVQA